MSVPLVEDNGVLNIDFCTSKPGTTKDAVVAAIAGGLSNRGAAVEKEKIKYK